MNNIEKILLLDLNFKLRPYRNASLTSNSHNTWNVKKSFTKLMHFR